MQKSPAILFTCFMLSVFFNAVSTTHCYGQESDTVRVSLQDTMAMVKQLLQQRLVNQVKQAKMTSQLVVAQQFLVDSSATGSIENIVLQKLQGIGQGPGRLSNRIGDDAMQVSKSVLTEKINAVLQMDDIKSMIGRMTGLTKRPAVALNTFSGNITGQAGKSFDNKNMIINTSRISGNMMVAGIPMGMQLISQRMSGPVQFSRTAFSFQFDKEAYLRSIRDRLKIKIQPADLLQVDKQLLEKIKVSALDRLNGAVDSIKTIDKEFFRLALEKFGSVESLLRMDADSLNTRLHDALQSVNTGHRKDNLVAVVDSLSNQSAIVPAGLDRIKNAIDLFKNELFKAGLTEKWKQYLQLDNIPLNGELPEGNKLKSMAAQQLNLNGFQQLLLNINQLSIGVNTISISPLTIYQYVNTGFNMSFTNNNRYLFVMAGKQNENNGLYGMPFQHSIFPAGGTAFGIRLGKGDLTENYSHLSIFNYRNGNNTNASGMASPPGNALVATLSKQLRLTESSIIGIEISKSNHIYNNAESIYDSLQQNNAGQKDRPYQPGIFQQMAFILQWDGKNKENELYYNLHVSNIGDAYSNPGNLFITWGKRSMGGSLRKSLLQNRLVLSTKLDYYEFHYGVSKVRSTGDNILVQAKWKFNKSSYLQLRYQAYDNLRMQENEQRASGKNRLFSAEAGFRKRFNRLTYQQSLSVSAMKNAYPGDSVAPGNTSILFNSMQTFIINNRTCYLNTQYNHSTAVSSIPFFSTWLHVTGGYSYRIGKNINGSTGMSYNSVKDWYQAVGLSQTISSQLNDRFTVNLFADIQQPIKEYRPYSLNNTWLNWSVQYSIK